MEAVIKSKGFKIAAITLGVIVIMLTAFAGGVLVGASKARFSCKWGENYERNFMGPRPGMNRPGMGGGFMPGPLEMMRKIEGRDFRNAHGLAGTILSVTDNSIVIKDRDNKENTVTVTDKTVIKNRRDDVKMVELKAGDEIVVMGDPSENGAINATLIRIFPGISNK